MRIDKRAKNDSTADRDILKNIVVSSTDFTGIAPGGMIGKAQSDNLEDVGDTKVPKAPRKTEKKTEF